MNKIQVLPEILANKIAAGEIVERPASAVKEMVENSLDAGSRAIHVEVRAGGKRSILVRDDGEGMGADDALLAFEHHATSKLRSADDLASIATLGFRGEALPSIASVSRLVLRTRRAEDAAGTEVEIHGGVMRSVKSIPWDRGTEIEARDLFHNIPARRKFLRANDTELGHVARLVTHYALAHPETRFTLVSEGRTLMDATAVPDIGDRVFQVFGDGFMDALIPFDGRDGAARAHGFTSLPQEQRTNAYSQYIFVNGRMVRDKVLIGAIRQAYRNYMPAASYPVTILFLDLPFEEVDVNAHPAKTEIRFREQNAVHRLVADAIDRALKENVAIPSYAHRPVPPFPAAPAGDDGAPRAFEDAGRHAPPASAPSVADAEAQWNLRPPPGLAQPSLNYPLPAGHAPYTARPMPDPAIMRQAPSGGAAGGLGAAAGLDLSGARILGQMHDSYIIASDAKGLLIVDQHVAHERILYEKFAAEAGSGRVETQGLLIPLALELTPPQMALAQRLLPELERNGFEVEPFGGASILIRSVPALAGTADGADSRALVAEILEGFGGGEGGGDGMDVEKLRDRIAIKSACHAAIKVNTPLGMEKMRWLLDELSRTDVPTNCPHGRPIILRFSLREIEKNFGRA
ncbi:MAG: DNA mismatch repair endonuclease MutL [Acidobacteriota bacterium]|jgi:DNA mismatch repair protein MutL|nr:DNA mismatch repair endonuclease MutL [Acidobacteriota bacterium]